MITGEGGRGTAGEGGPDARAFRRGVRLAVDVGTVRVGLAASDPDGLVASPVRTLARDSRRDSDLAEIAAEVLERGAVEVVVGLPKSLDGQERSAAGVARDYAVRLARRVAPVPVRLVDERLSTVGAHRALHDAGVGGRKHRNVVDQMAAALVLQTALETEKSTGRAPGSLVGTGSPPDGPAAKGGQEASSG